MTNLAPPPRLRNRYYGFRHGQSEANVQGIILSDPKLGTKRYGLTEAGRAQVVESVRIHHAVLERAAVYSSDFLRTKQTAEMIVTELGLVASIRFDRRLRERFFGRFDGGPHDAYAKVWDEDRKSPASDANGVEPVIRVAERVSACINEIEGKLTDADVVLVGHGDPLQITEAWLHGDELGNHTTHRFETAEMRLLNPA